MKTLHTTNRRNANRRRRNRSVMTLTGIVAAMFCIMSLLNEVRSTQRMETRVPRLMEASKIVAADLLLEVKTWL